jgi:hypothetical protein
VALLLLFLIVSAWIVCFRCFGPFSLVGALLLGFSAYSIPAVAGFYLSPSTRGLAIAPASQSAVALLAWAWTCAIASLVCGSRFRPAAVHRPSNCYLQWPRCRDLATLRIFSVVCAALSTAVFLSIVQNEGVLYFLEQRQTVLVESETQKMLWRWINLFGLISSLSCRSRFLSALFLSYIAIYFIAGDRTMLLISGVAVLVFFYDGNRQLTQWKRLVPVVLALLLGLLVFTGKPLYHAMKTQSLQPLALLFNDRYAIVNLSFFEPFVSHAILEDVLRRGFSYPLSDLVTGVAGQLLLVPSAFGIDSSAFNARITEDLYPRVRYGMAAHYLAQGWSVGGYTGVAVFVVLLFASVFALQHVANRSGHVARIFIVILGVTAGTYFYRNSMENLLAFLRQIVLVGAVLIGVSAVLVRQMVPAGERLPCR